MPSPDSALGRNFKYLNELTLSNSKYLKLPIENLKEFPIHRKSTADVNFLVESADTLLAYQSKPITGASMFCLPDKPWILKVLFAIDPDDSLKLFEKMEEFGH